MHQIRKISLALLRGKKRLKISRELPPLSRARLSLSLRRSSPSSSRKSNLLRKGKQKTRINPPNSAMQAKISAFFKPSTPNDSDAAILSDDVIAPVFSAKQEILVTYKRRAPNSNPMREDDNACEFGNAQKEQPVCFDSKLNDQDACCVHSDNSVKSASIGRALNNKRSYAQYHLELGQSDFLLHTCSICGLKYARGDEEDERVHKTFHRNYYHGIQFKGWRNERVVPSTSSNGDRIILVLDGDPPAHKHKVAEVIKIMEWELGLTDEWLLHNACKVYLFISKQRITGCLVAEPIRNAYRVISSSVACKSLDITNSKVKSNATRLQFGSVTFQREIIRKLPSTGKSSETIDMDEKGAVLCEEKAVLASCGIRAIWVAPSGRRKRIATQLLDALRKNFCKGQVLEPSQCAFSQPTSSGKALASSYSGTESFLIYLTGTLTSGQF